jgi:hypothetical protein|tara:strand:+ start:690 stop:1421 length:732 start_codon:yes stop_codon:yes gene_type:complete
MSLSKSQFLTLVQAAKAQRYDRDSTGYDVLIREEGAEELSANQIDELVNQAYEVVSESGTNVDKGKVRASLLGEVLDEDVYEAGDWIRCYDLCGSASIEAHGRWASHTGFRSIITVTEEENIETLFEEASKSTFLVGRSDAEGWKELSETWNAPDQVMIRFPCWHTGEVAWVLYELAGLRLNCSLNGYWVFPARYSKAQLKSLLAPVLTKGTRLTDEQVLAEEIRRSTAAVEFQGLMEQPSFF